MTGGAARRTPGRRRPGLGVELAGIPGAGKSRLARVLAAGLAARGVVVHQPQEARGPSVPTGRRLARKSLACGAAALGDPATTARIVRAVVHSGQPGAGDVAGRVVQWLVAQHLLSGTRRRGGVSLLDEGLVQCLWSIGLRGDVAPVLEAAAASRRTSAPDMVVVVRVPPELALARLTARPSLHSRTQLLPEHERLAELQRGTLLLDRLVEWLPTARPSARVLSVSRAGDGPEDHEPLLDRICASLDGSMGSDGTAS